MKKQLLIFICLFSSFEVKSEQIFITCEMKHVKKIGSDGVDLMKEWDWLGEGTYTQEFFVDSKKKDIEKRLFKRENFDRKLFNKFEKLQFSSLYKKKKSHFIIKNDFKKQSVKNEIKNILKKIL